MPAKKPNYQDIARSFLGATVSLARSTGTDEVVLPATDVMYHEEEHAFYYYDGSQGVWKIVSDTDKEVGAMAKLLTSFLLTAFPDLNITTQTIQEVKYSIARLMDKTFRESMASKHAYTAFKDGLFNWRTFQLEPHSKDKFAFHSFDFDCPFGKPAIPTPIFDAYLARCFPGDKDMPPFVLEMFGYYLLPFADEPAAFYVYGVARAGKSVMLDIVKEMIGDQYTCSFSLQSLTGDKYTVAELAGKRVNIQDEDESEYVLPDKLKALISQSKVQAERKYAPPFSFRPRCKFLFGSNQLPNFKNVDEGLKRRLYFVEFKHALEKHEQDKKITEKLIAEMPGIVQKSMNAAKQFVERGQEFEIPEASVRTGEQFVIENESVLSFFHETYLIAPDAADDNVPSDGWTASAEMYEKYQEWCRLSGKKPKSRMKFVKILDFVKGLKTARTNAARYRSCKLRASPQIEAVPGYTNARQEADF